MDKEEKKVERPSDIVLNLDNMDSSNTNFIQVGEPTPLPASTVTTVTAHPSLKKMREESIGHQLRDILEEKDDSYEGPDHPGVFDVIIQKLVSRKLFIWLTSTVLFILGFISPDIWLTVSGAYIGSQSLIEIVEKLKTPGAKSTPPGEGEA